MRGKATIKNLDISVLVLDFNFKFVEEIKGEVQRVDLSINAEADIRRSCSVSIIVSPLYLRDYYFSGNPYWFNKYIQIKVYVNDTWYNLGFYMINAPSVSYSAEQKTLSFQAVDLMSKLTGLRNGFLEGIEYQIKQGSSITGSMIDILRTQNVNDYLLIPPPVNEVPFDINIEIGQTSYDLLTQLRDIYPFHEIYFDAEGFFRYQKQIISNQTPVLKNDEIKERCLGWEISTDFEHVKNYVEVIGAQITPNEWAEVQGRGGNGEILLKLSKDFSDYFSDAEGQSLPWVIGFILGEQGLLPEILMPEATSIIINEKSGVAPPIEITFNKDEQIRPYYTNESYCLKINCDNSSVITSEFLGYLQPRAIAFESNPKSPFYVGNTVDYKCKLNGTIPEVVSMINSKRTNLITIDSAGENGTALVNLISILSLSNFNAAENGKEWKFILDLKRIDESPVSLIDFIWGDVILEQFLTNSNEAIITSESEDFYAVNDTTQQVSGNFIYKDSSSYDEANRISLDFKGKYLFTIKKDGSVPKIIIKYFPILANNFSSATTKVWDTQKFSNIVRIVLSGDEFENIYSNKLALDRAKYELYMRCRIFDSLSLTCVPFYNLDVDSLIEFEVNEGGNAPPALWVVKSISTEVDVSGVQQINAMRYYPEFSFEANS